MKSVEFCYWLQGFFELVAPDGDEAAVALTAKQTDMIRAHLALVFKHEIDPSYSRDPKVQAELNAIHEGPKKPKKKPPGLGPIEPFNPLSTGFDGTVYRC